MKQQLNTRISDITRQQLDELTASYGTQTTVLAIAIDRLWTDTFSRRQTVRTAVVTVWIPATTSSGGPDITNEETITVEEWEYMQPPWYGDIARCIAERSGNTQRFVRWADAQRRNR